jgi:hypothetical protein
MIECNQFVSKYRPVNTLQTVLADDVHIIIIIIIIVVMAVMINRLAFRHFGIVCLQNKHCRRQNLSK